jgi:hypothetical protein
MQLHPANKFLFAGCWGLGLQGRLLAASLATTLAATRFLQVGCLYADLAMLHGVSPWIEMEMAQEPFLVLSHCVNPKEGTACISLFFFYL